jgi:hypothetical protein
VLDEQFVDLATMRGIALRAEVELDGAKELVFGSRDHEDTLAIGNAAP